MKEIKDLGASRSQVDPGRAKPRRRELAGLLARIDVARPDQQWALIRDAARALLDIDDLVRARINGLCDAGGHTDAALALMERVLPGVFYHISRFSDDGGSEAHIYPGRGLGDDYEGSGSTPALALLAALLSSEAQPIGLATRSGPETGTQG